MHIENFGKKVRNKKKDSIRSIGGRGNTRSCGSSSSSRSSKKAELETKGFTE
jgi:hypothetical protein